MGMSTRNTMAIKKLNMNMKMSTEMKIAIVIIDI
jgi:hypothetical protein